MPGLAGVAAQFGFTLPATATSGSPEFYADLVTSHPILVDLVEDEYAMPGQELPVSLVEWYEVESDDPGVRVEVAAEELADRLSVNIVRRTGVVLLAVQDRVPELAKEVLVRALALLNEYNLETRQSQARKERQFVEARLETARAELDFAEGQLEEFLTQNRNFRNSPQLAFEHDRLDRQFQMASQVSTSLAQAYERARIEEVRNTPVITIVEEPFVNARPDRRRLVAKALVSLALGGLLALGLVTVFELIAASKVQDPVGYREMEALRHEAIRDLTRFLGRGQGAKGPRDLDQ